MITSWSRASVRQSAIRVNGVGSSLGSATSTAKPCELRNCPNQAPIFPAPPMIRTRLPAPLVCAATRVCSCWVNEERIKQAHDLLRQFRLETEFHRFIAGAFQHFALALIIASRHRVLDFVGTNLRNDFLPGRHQSQ